MGLLLGLIIILIAMLVIGVEVKVILGIVLGIIGLIIAFMTVFFIGCGVVLLGTKKCSASFSRIGKKGENGFERAYYTIDGCEYPNAFPCEVAFRDMLYRSGKETVVRLSEKKKMVFDKNAVYASVAGAVISPLLCIAGAIVMYYL